jgi:hypothetical protein
MKRFALLLLLLTPALPGQPTDDFQDQYVKKRIVILLSSRDYRQAESFARRVATRAQVKLDLRDLQPNKSIGLTFPKQHCEDGGFDYPCYIARGRYDDGEYISVEHSSAFAGFRPGYYIVVGASYENGKPEVKRSLTKFKQYASDAYAKLSKVYVGCIH